MESWSDEYLHSNGRGDSRQLFPSATIEQNNQPIVCYDAMLEGLHVLAIGSGRTRCAPQFGLHLGTLASNLPKAPDRFQQPMGDSDFWAGILRHGRIPGIEELLIISATIEHIHHRRANMAAVAINVIPIKDLNSKAVLACLSHCTPQCFLDPPVLFKQPGVWTIATGESKCGCGSGCPVAPLLETLLEM